MNKKRKIIPTLALALIHIPLTAVTITNPGFESDFSGWTDAEPSAISTSDVHSGTKSAKVTGSGGRVEQTVTVSTNTDYTLKAWIYEAGTIGAEAGSNDYSDGGSYGSFTEVSVNFNSGSNSSVTIYGEYNGGTGRFDDFTLEEDTSGGGYGGDGVGSSEACISTVSASSNDGNVPANTVDGNLGTRWSAQGSGEWIEYELEAEGTVAAVDIAWYNGNTRQSDFDIETSTDGTTWTLVYSGSSSGTTTSLETYDVDNTTADWVRITGYGNSSNNWNSITEVEIWGSGGCSGGGGSAPGQVTGLSANAGDGQVDLTWTSLSGADDYNVKRSTSSGGSYTTIQTGVTSTSYSDTSVTNGTTYYYVVSGENTNGEGSNSSEESATPQTSGGGSTTIDFSSLSTSAYGNDGGTYQDGSGAEQVQDSGATLYLNGNRWRDIPYSYTVTADTVLEFDFKSTQEGEIQAIGFDNDDDQENSLRAFYLYGSQGWTNSYDSASSPSFPEYGGSGNWENYIVYVGEFYTGSFDRIFFVNDGDSTSGNGYFRNVKVYEDTSGGSSGGGSLDPNAPPGDNFDLSTWKITFPDGSEEKEDWLTGGGESANEFYTDTSTGGMVFRCLNIGGSTSGSSYSRSELREMLRAGNTSISTTGINGNNWVLSSSSQSNQNAAGGVDGTLNATITVDHVSTTGDSGKVGRVIVGQIHASNDEPCRLYYRKLPGNSKGSVYFAHEPTSGSEQWYEMIGSRGDSASNPSDGIALGEEWSYEIDAQGDTLTITIMREGKSDVVETVDMSNSGFADDWLYFKAGNYNQNNTGDSSDYAQVTFYSLSNVHY